ncbi:MAG TPA: DNA polymerase III subunit epsilon [Wenzhouxiangella sp.]
MRRQIVLDTETTGLEPDLGHRIVEIGCVEIDDRRVTDRHFHCYLNPDRLVEGGALEVHGITDAFLEDKPRFRDIVDDFLAFIEGSELIIHNAPFDVGFLNAELARLDRSPTIQIAQVADVLDTVALARELHPGQRVSLDALCKRYEIDNSSRQLHGALLDAELLADVYLLMTGGQVDLGLSMRSGAHLQADQASKLALDLSALVCLRASEAEVEAHQKQLESIRAQSGQCVWLD